MSSSIDTMVMHSRPFSVAASATSVTLIPALFNRKGAYISNDSTAIMYVLCAIGDASTTNFTVKLFGGDDMTLKPGDYSGIISAIWASATGSARVTEFT